MAAEPVCRICKNLGLVTATTEVDHIIPMAKGGGHGRDNLQGICTPCHKRKTADEALEARGFKVKLTTGIDGWPLA
jgi:5-methylcytosine-specific restriction protein A